MALSLAFHIIFSCIDMVMPFFMADSHFYYLRTGKIVFRNITRNWSKGVPIFFATGAISGTVLSFELRLLWPGFRATAFFHYSKIILLSGDEYLSLVEHHGDEKSIEPLGVALLIGSVFILPALGYLIYSFQKKRPVEL